MENLTTKWWDEKSDIVSSSSDEESSEHDSFVPEDENCKLNRNCHNCFSECVFFEGYFILLSVIGHIYS